MVFFYEINDLGIHEVTTEVSGSVKYHQRRVFLLVKFTIKFMNAKINAVCNITAKF